MSLRKRKNLNWVTPIGNDFTWQHVEVDLLQDIRDELRSLNETLAGINCLLHCRNFIAIPRKLDAIRLNTDRKKKAHTARNGS